MCTKSNVSPMLVRIFITLLLTSNLSAAIHILELLTEYGLGTTYGIKTASLPSFTEYDFIIVGSGPGGSPVANRLSENKNWKVLLLEAGKPEGILHQVPMLEDSFLNTEFDWQYRVEPQKKACLGIEDQRCTYPKGKSLGGSSSINGMLYARGNKLDFDNWAKMGNYGWSYKDILPYFRKSERAKLQEPVDPSYHSEKGYLHVQHAPWRTPLASAFLQSGEEMRYNVIDYNGQRQIGFSYNQATMLNGTRCSASKAYLRVRRANLDIVTEAMVSKVLINADNHAYGVEFTKNNRSYQINATKEVILSVGAINTPQLLMLSGIGPKDHLQEMGIEVVKHSAVGYNLNDHMGFFGLTFLVNQSVTLIANNIQTPEAAIQYAVKGSGPYSVPGLDEGVAFIRTKYAIDRRPDMELIYRAATVNMDNDDSSRRGRRITKLIYETLWEPLIGKDAFAIWPTLQFPRSKGYVKLRSTNIEDHPIIDPKFLEDAHDVEVLLEGIKFAIELSKSNAFRRFGIMLDRTKIPGCELLEFGTDDYWRCAIRHLTIGYSHDVGTAKMGPATDTAAVVDPELRVYGVGGLRVCDASIMPEMPVGHLVATIYMIAEKAADMIKSSWKR